MTPEQIEKERAAFEAAELIHPKSAYNRDENGRYKLAQTEIMFNIWLTRAKLDKQRWIPASERLPEFHGLYIVVLDTAMGIITTVELYSQDHNPRFPWQTNFGERILFWQPLPEPIKPCE